MSARKSGQAAASRSSEDRWQAKLRKLDQLNESITRRDKRITSAFRRWAKRTDRSSHASR